MIVDVRSHSDGTAEVITKCPFCSAQQTIMVDEVQFHKCISWSLTFRSRDPDDRYLRQLRQLLS